MTRNLTAAERHILEHATGWCSKEPLYRNYFSTHPRADDWALCQQLAERGLLSRGRDCEVVTVFTVTPAGIALLEQKGEVHA